MYACMYKYTHIDAQLKTVKSFLEVSVWFLDGLLPMSLCFLLYSSLSESLLELFTDAGMASRALHVQARTLLLVYIRSPNQIRAH